jgi:mycothiol synthase
MKNPAYIIRNYRPEDFESLVQLVGEVGTRGEGLYSISLQDVIESLDRPRHFPESNLFIAEKAGDIIGYVDVTAELEIGRVVLSFLVHPVYWGNGFVTELIGRAIDRARELRIKRAHVNIPQESMTARKLFTKMGFRFIRRFLELTLDLSEFHEPHTGLIAPRYRHMKTGEEDKLVYIQNRSFADTWGFNPNTVEEIAYRIGLPNCSPEDIILRSDADKVVGYCWTRIYVGKEKEPRGGRGRIHMLGVDPDQRSKGIGKEMLLAGLSYMKSKCLRTVEVTVDSKNRAALALYRSAGFQVRTRSLWYEKALE